MIRIFLFCVLVWSFTDFAHGQSDTLIYLPNIQIGDQRISIPFSKASRTITLLTKKEITKISAQSLNETLGYISGVDIKNQGVKGGQADLSIRGSTFEQVLVMINGIKMNDPQTGHHALNIPVPLESIERIEVLKGPGARRFGQNAFAGAINIITKIPEKDMINVGVEAGSYGNVSGQLGASLHHGGFHQSAQLSYLRSDGYRHNTDFDIANIFYQNEWNQGKGTWSTMAGFSKRKFGANGFYGSPNFTNQYEEVETSIASLSYKYIGNRFHIKPNFQWRRNQDEYILFRGQPEIYRNLHFGNSIGFDVQSGIYSDIGLTGLGAEWRKIYLKSNNLGQHQRDELAIYLEHRFEFFDTKLTLTPGISYNYFTNFGDFFYPGVDLGYQFNKTWTAYGNIGDTYRIPTYTDLFYVGPTNIGNEDLIPEKATSFEVGLKYIDNLWYWNIALFRRSSDDLIDWVKNEEDLPWMPRNYYHAFFNGIEVDQKWTLPTNNLGLQDINLTYNYISAKIENQNEAIISRYALDHLRHQLILRSSGQVMKNWSYSIGLRYLDRVNLEDYFLGDLKINFEAMKGIWYAQINNIFNTEYTETSLIPMPGRTFNIGFKRNFYLN